MGILPELDRGGMVTLRWLGQGGFLFCSPDNVKWAVDAYLTDYSNRGMRINRLNPPPLIATELCVDAVFTSHSHYDHHDPETLMAVAANSDADFYGACEATAILRSLGVDTQRVHAIAVGDEFLLGDNDSSDVRWVLCSL